ncbi:hypothetical protein B7494_g3563 [Chlorociboria aeruginascens]|nr:hypothetical protein B7494_g3563 [Chlorociboria aeruginascens]
MNSSQRQYPSGPQPVKRPPPPPQPPSPPKFTFGFEVETLLMPREDVPEIWELLKEQGFDNDAAYTPAPAGPRQRRTNNVAIRATIAKLLGRRLFNYGNHGIEIVSPVLSLEDSTWVTGIEIMWEILMTFFHIKAHISCGTHVHVRKVEQFSDQDIIDVAKAVTWYGQQITQLLPHERGDTNSWAVANVQASPPLRALYNAAVQQGALPNLVMDFNNKTREEIIGLVGKSKSIAFNFSNLNKSCLTIEYRQPPQVIDVEHHLHWVAFTLGFFGYALTHNWSTAPDNTVTRAIITGARAIGVSAHLKSFETMKADSPRGSPRSSQQGSPGPAFPGYFSDSDDDSSLARGMSGVRINPASSSSRASTSGSSAPAIPAGWTLNPQNPNEITKTDPQSGRTVHWNSKTDQQTYYSASEHRMKDFKAAFGYRLK